MVAAPHRNGGVLRRTIEPSGPSEVTCTGDLRLLDAEPEFEHGLTALDLAFARKHLKVQGWSLTIGRWDPGAEFAEPLAVLLIDGLVLREADTPHGPDTELFGPGDLLDPRLFTAPHAAYSVLIGADIALLDTRLLTVAGRCPAIIAPLVRSLFDAARAHHQIAVVRALARVEERVYAFMSDRAERWGKVTPAGITLTLPVTHETLGQLVGARRPTISLALKQLDHERRLERLPDGRWLMRRA